MTKNRKTINKIRKSIEPKARFLFFENINKIGKYPGNQEKKTLPISKLNYQYQNQNITIYAMDIKR